MSRIFAYSRVSTDTQTTENQRLVLDDYVLKKFNEKILDHRYFAENISGSVPYAERPAFQAMLSKLEPDDNVVVYSVDRLGRNTLDVLNCIEFLTGEMRCKLHIVKFNIDFNDPVGKVLLTILASFASLEKQLLVSRVKDGIARAKTKGKKLGRPSVVKRLEKKGFNINDVMSDLANGSSVLQVAKKFNMSLMSVYRLRKIENEKYADDVKKYFEIEIAKLNNNETFIKNVSFKNKAAKYAWNDLTTNLQKIILNSISDKELKMRIDYLLSGENFEMLPTK